MRRHVDVGALGAANRDPELGTAPEDENRPSRLGTRDDDLVQRPRSTASMRVSAAACCDPSSPRARHLDVDAGLVPRLDRDVTRRDRDAEGDATGCVEARHRSASREPRRDGGAGVDARVAARAAGGARRDRDPSGRRVRTRTWMLLPLAPGEALEPVRRSPRGARLEGARERADDPGVGGDPLARRPRSRCRPSALRGAAA